MIHHGSVWEELRLLAGMAWPLAVSFLGTFALTFVNVVVAGHLGETEIAAVLMGALVTNITGFALIVGMASGIESLASQAFGAQNYAAVGHVLVRACCICLLLIALPAAIVWFNAEAILRGLGQNATLAQLAGRYARLMVPSLPGYVCFEAAKRWLQCQGVTTPVFAVGLAIVPVHIVSCVTLTRRLGFDGLPIALTLSYWLCLLMLIAYIALRSPHHSGTWAGVTLHGAFGGWCQYLRLGFPSLLMLSLEWWSFEILALIAGLISVQALAAHSIVATIVPCMFMISLGEFMCRCVRWGFLSLCF